MSTHACTLPSPLALALLALVLPSCLENEEELTVHPDGSVRVVVRARGDASDLADGYPVPLAAPWLPESQDARRWIETVGVDPAAPGAAERALALFGGREPDPELALARDFARVEDLPRLYALADDPYREAYLARETTLDVREVDGRTVYVFERRYPARSGVGRDTLGRIGDELPEDVLERLEHDEALTPEQWRRVAGVVARTYAELSERLVRDATLGLYTRGTAALPPAALERLVAGLAARMDSIFSAERLSAWYATVQAGDAEAEEIDGWFRDPLREELASALATAGVSERERNAARFALEEAFTASDHDVDLSDEVFRVALRLPGTLVGGNYASAEDGTARWEFEGEDLVGHDVVLSAVSVLE